MEKLVAFYTPPAIKRSPSVGLEARKAMVRAGRFDAVKADHVLAWEDLWRRFDVRIRRPIPASN